MPTLDCTKMTEAEIDARMMRNRALRAEEMLLGVIEDISEVIGMLSKKNVLLAEKSEENLRNCLKEVISGPDAYLSLRRRAERPKQAKKK